MFKVIISDSVYQTIVSTEEQKASGARSYLYKILKQQPVQQLSAADTARLKTSPENVLKHPSALYVLDISAADALAIQRNYGVMCLSGGCPDVSPLIDINDIHIAHENEKLGRGWDTVLDSVEMLPSNALLMTDRYLFANRRPTAGDGIANIKSILAELLPRQFSGDRYHVTVVFDNMSKHATYSFNDIARLLEQVKQELACPYAVTMEVLGITPDCPAYNKLHNRMIVSNYYLVEAGHKLAAFNKHVGTARQLLLPMALFTESSLNGRSTAPLTAIDQTLSTLRDFSKSLSTRTSHNDYCYAVDGKRMERCISIRNRLIK